MKHERKIKALAKRITKMGEGEPMFKGKAYAHLPKVIFPETFQKMGELGLAMALLILEQKET